MAENNRTIRGEFKGSGQDSPRHRDLREAREKGNRPLVCNCKAAGCAQICNPGEYYCSYHQAMVAEQGNFINKPKYVQREEHFGGTSHNVSYPTHVGAPENGKNKL